MATRCVACGRTLTTCCQVVMDDILPNCAERSTSSSAFPQGGAWGVSQSQPTLDHVSSIDTPRVSSGGPPQKRSVGLSPRPVNQIRGSDGGLIGRDPKLHQPHLTKMQQRWPSEPPGGSWPSQQQEQQRKRVSQQQSVQRQVPTLSPDKSAWKHSGIKEPEWHGQETTQKLGPAGSSLKPVRGQASLQQQPRSNPTMPRTPEWRRTETYNKPGSAEVVPGSAWDQPRRWQEQKSGPTWVSQPREPQQPQQQQSKQQRSIQQPRIAETPVKSAWGSGPPQPTKSQGVSQTQSARSEPHRYQQKPPKHGVVQQSDVQETTSRISQLSLQTNRETSLARTNSKANVTTEEAQNQALAIPKRKNPKLAGTLGRKIVVLVNMLKIRLGSNFPDNVIHYDVKFVPDVPKYLFLKAFSAATQQLCRGRNPAFDGKKNAFSAGRLFPEDDRTIEVTVLNEDEREKKFQVTLKVVGNLDLTWMKNTSDHDRIRTINHQHCLQALDVILRTPPSLQAIIVGRSFFKPPRHPIYLGGGMELYQGLYQSALFGWGYQVYLNVDVAHKGFPKSQSVLETIKNICGYEDEPQGDYGGGGGRGGGRGGRGRGGGREGGRGGYQQRPATIYHPSADDYFDMINRNREKIEKFLKGLKVEYEIPKIATSKRTFRINGLLNKSPREDGFEFQGHTISVEQYYRLEKQYLIQYPDLPLLSVGPQNKNIHVPIELCKVVGNQVTQKKLDEKQTSKMIRAAATGTNERQLKIKEAFRSMNHLRDPCIQEFDISLDNEFEKVNARILDPPNLEYRNNEVVRVSRGTWKADKFLNPKNLEDGSWTIICLDYHVNPLELQTLAESLQRAAVPVGMKIGQPSHPFQMIEWRGMRQLEEKLRNFKPKNYKLVIVVFPDNNEVRCKVKQQAELNNGILTQCIRSKTLKKLDPSTCGNILFKINAKLSGTNHALSPTTSDRLPECLEQDCYAMICGADVTHPSPDSQNIPSIAAVVSSHDRYAYQYNVEFRLQPARQELIGDMAQIMINHLNKFKKAMSRYPSQIIFYRDGVSEGQFSQIIDNELRDIRQACQRCYIEKMPITFVVVQKRHHIRFFPTHKDDSDDPMKGFNVKAGTIVDTLITHPTDIVFYLVSHASIQGTARPTKYTCLCNDKGMSEDEIEKLTYYLCHVYTRCARSVSYPAPTYYAHLAAFRGRALIYGTSMNMENLAEEQRKKMTIKPEVLERTPMFFV
ncbi:hypothetical protein QAD02_004884 [Eretmocerus hayati]|uniref:Uncharacterized protein n=1 Tax=Eretmocerus hayati TaxID=131215 RepID=A0ACC2NR97_9HYME|nr:hypothetical protein QAD02_004884 [Eretmocerus hayati]